MELRNSKYSMSFTVGALLYNESVTVAELYDEMADWDAVRGRAIEENLLQIRTLRSATRIYQEVSTRLKKLTDPQLDLFNEGSRYEQNHLLWLDICKRYRFIFDFAVEVIREKYLRLDLDVSYNDYDLFFYDKAEWYPEVEHIAESTREKQRQVVFKMLREAELLNLDNQIIPAMLSPHLIEVIGQDDPAHFAIYPLSPADIQVWLT